MRRIVALGIIFSIVLIATVFLNWQVPTAKSANFVGQTIYLKADGSIEPSDAPIDVHGTTYTLTGDIQCPPRGYCINIERSGVLLDGAGYKIEGWNPQNEPGTSSFAIYAGFVSNIEIRNITIKGCANGIEFQSVSQARIQKTTINGQTQTEGSEPIGIFIMYCDSATIDQNQIVKNYMGILVQSSNCSITNNRIMDNTGGGVTLATSGASLISNLIARNDLGVDIQSSNNLIQDNDILNNKRIGVLVGASNNLFSGNNIAGQNSANAYGIQMGPYEGGNTFRHNDFENNYIQVEGGDFAYITNIWDNGYPSGGNYWDTYRGLDSYAGSAQNETGSDGVGDIPYQITQANIDHYPLMQPVRSNPDISEETITQTDYTLPLMFIGLIVVCVIIALIVVFWRRKKKKKLKETAPAQQKALVRRSSILVLLTLSILIILNFAFITSGTYQLGSIELYGGALYFDEILIGFLSSIAGFLLTWKIFIRQEYTSGKLREVLAAAIVSFLFVAYLLAYTAYRQFELFGLLQEIQPTLVMAWTFATTLIGCTLGFWLGGIVLKRRRYLSDVTAKPEKNRVLFYSRLASIIVLVFAGLVAGYAFGYISWGVFGQVQVVLGESFPYSSVFPPSLIYLLGWAVAGAVVFPLIITFKRVESHSY